MRKAELVSGVLALVIGTGCSSAPERVRDHVVMFNEEGTLIDPCDNRAGWILPYKELKPKKRADYLDRLFENASRAWDRLKRKDKDGAESASLLVFIHGGLNTQKGSIDRADRLHPRMLDEGHYPIFVNWKSSLWSSYFDHLLFVRQGTNWGILGTLLSPVYLAADLGRGLARLPFVWGTEFRRIANALPGLEPSERRKADKIAEDLLERQAKGCCVFCREGSAHGGHEHREDHHHPAPEACSPIERGEDLRSTGELALSGIIWSGTLPIKLVTSPLVDAVGMSAWDMMLRRADLLFHKEEDYLEADADPHPRTGVPMFVERLKRFQDDEGKKGRCWKVTLVGHSMGAIIITRLLAKEYLGFLPRIDRIVFMAAAAGVRDYEHSLYPFLLKSTETDLFHLTLNPSADAAEAMGYELAPRGSLLVWIDDFLAKPLTPMDQVVGTYTSLLLSSHDVPAALHGRIHFKIFSFGAAASDGSPQGHGDFDDFPFWREEFYAPRAAEKPVAPSPTRMR